MKIIKTTYLLILITLFVYIFGYLGYKEVTTEIKPIKQPIRKELKKTKSTIIDYQNEYDNRKCV